MLSNGWYWSGENDEEMTYPVAGWDFRCVWERLNSGRWALRISVREKDPAPWIPGLIPEARELQARPEVDGHRSWPSPSAEVMEDLSSRIGSKRVKAIIGCIPPPQTLHNCQFYY